MILKKLSVCFFILFLLSACKVTELAFYEHEPSRQFYNTFDVDLPELHKFKCGSVLLTASVKKATHKEYIVWLGVYTTDSGQTVEVEEARIYSHAWSGKHQYYAKEIEVSHSVPSSNLKKESLKLFTISSDLLKEVAINASNKILLDVTCSQSGKEQTIQFELIPRTEKHTVFPT